MKSTWTKILTLVIVMFGFTAVNAQVVVVSVNSWREEVDENDLTIPTEAGFDLNPTIETSPSFNKLDVLNVAKSKGWKVAVSRRDINWPAAFSISVRRTSTGIPCGGCMGVDNGASPSGYLPVGPMEMDFVLGTGEVTDIDVQMRVQGLSLTLDVDAYSTEIIYTLYGD